MKIEAFATEHFFAKYEFTTPYQLCNSDCETVTVEELLAMTDMSLEEFRASVIGLYRVVGQSANAGGDCRCVSGRDGGGCAHSWDTHRGHLSGGAGDP